MTPESLAIANAARRIKSLQQLASDFRAHVQATGNSDNVLGFLYISSEGITASCLGRLANARERIVQEECGNFAVEFTFMTGHLECQIPILVFKLSSNGHVVTSNSPNGEDRLCDWNNPYIATHLLSALGTRLMNSHVLKPTAQN